MPSPPRGGLGVGLAAGQNGCAQGHGEVWRRCVGEDGGALEAEPGKVGSAAPAGGTLPSGIGCWASAEAAQIAHKANADTVCMRKTWLFIPMVLPQCRRMVDHTDIELKFIYFFMADILTCRSI